jgi:hypothetical protein
MNTEYNIYCDESRHTSDTADQYLVIGAMSCPRDAKREIVHRVRLLQAKHGARGEFGWNKVAPGKAAFFEELTRLFLELPELRFRCLITDRTQLKHDEFNEGDKELGFYKLYYQTLVHWLEPGNTYHVYLDWQQNACQERFSDLRLVLSRKLSGRAKLACLEPVSSHELPLLQLTDLLIGAVGYAWNHRTTSLAKLAYCESLAKGLNKPSLVFSSPWKDSDPKFNIFNFQGQ